jgi:hypothetical protein
MKRIILAIIMIVTTFGSALAGGLTKAENDATIQAGHQLIATKTAQLESNLKAHNIQAAQTVATEILTLLHKGMRHGNERIMLEAEDQKKAANTKYLQMEAAANQYKMLSTNVSANGTQLVAKAKEYLNAY